MSDLVLDECIEKLRQGEQLPEKTLVSLLTKLMEVLYTESNVLELQSPIVICGDIHGQLYDLFQLFDKACDGEITNQKFLFMGDYVDRGRYSIETFAYLAALKLKYPQQFYLLRGNHECRQVNQMYGFYAEAMHCYGHVGIWTICNDVFDILPMAAVVDGKIFSVHGGLSPKVNLIEKIALLDRNQELPSQGELCDLCWSDPEDVNTWRQNTRGAGYLFGVNETEAFCRNNNLMLVTRSHQIAQKGYDWWFNDKLITVWSAPNYMYRSGNKASVMIYRGETNAKDIELREFEPCPEELRKKPSDPAPGTYFL